MKNFLIVLCLISFVGCDSNDVDTEEEEASVLNSVFDDFISEVKTSAGNNSVECGQVKTSESDIETNVCVFESYTNNIPFYAIYQRQGIDSFVAGAISQGEDGLLFIWSYDSSASGSESNPRTLQVECIEPTLTGTVDNGYLGIFDC